MCLELNSTCGKVEKNQAWLKNVEPKGFFVVGHKNLTLVDKTLNTVSVESHTELIIWLIHFLQWCLKEASSVLCECFSTAKT